MALGKGGKFSPFTKALFSVVEVCPGSGSHNHQGRAAFSIFLFPATQPIRHAPSPPRTGRGLG